MLSITHDRTTGHSFRLMTHSIKVKAVHKQILKSFKAQDKIYLKKSTTFHEGGGGGGISYRKHRALVTARE